jgi:hypothetical protein
MLASFEGDRLVTTEQILQQVVERFAEAVAAGDFEIADRWLAAALVVADRAEVADA